MNMEEKFKIQEVIARFANSFDLKDWDGLQSCLNGSLYTDYSDLRGTPPQTVSVAEYVTARRETLDHLKLHHMVSNYKVDITDTSHATCRASMVIWRRSEAEEFTSHCVYEFQLTKHGEKWKISGITQKILWNDGNASLHTGAKG